MKPRELDAVDLLTLVVEPAVGGTAGRQQVECLGAANSRPPVAKTL
jgi:hypothetical protein